MGGGDGEGRDGMGLLGSSISIFLFLTNDIFFFERLIFIFFGLESVKRRFWRRGFNYCYLWVYQSSEFQGFFTVGASFFVFSFFFDIWMGA